MSTEKKGDNMSKGKNLSRREFLKDVGLVAGGIGAVAFLGACSKVTETVTSTQAPSTVTSTATSTKTATTTAVSTTTSTAISTTTSTAVSTTTATTTATSTFSPGTGNVQIGGAFSLTGAYAEDCTAILAAYTDYAKYVNETKLMAPWRTDKFPAGVTINLTWRDDALDVAKVLSIYQELKAGGLMMEKMSGSAQAQALIDTMNTDHVGAISQATGPYLMTPPRTIFSYYPIYTDSMAAVADWFLTNWKDTTKKPKVAYLTADSSLGKSLEVPEMRAYLESKGFEFAGSQYVPQVPTSPPTTQLSWLKDNKVDLTLGCMVNPGSQPTIAEATRLGMGPNLAYKITFAFASPSHLAVFAPAMGQAGNGVVVGGSFAPLTDLSFAGNQFMADLQTKYRPTAKITHVMYAGGILEAMFQVEALRLALQLNTVSQLTPAKVLNDGIYRIRDLDTGGISSTKLNYGLGNVEGVSQVRLDQDRKSVV